MPGASWFHPLPTPFVRVSTSNWIKLRKDMSHIIEGWKKLHGRTDSWTWSEADVCLKQENQTPLQDQSDAQCPINVLVYNNVSHMNDWLVYTWNRGKEKWLHSRRGPAASNLNPLCQAASLLSFDINDVCIASASTTHSVFFDGIECGPVFIFLDAFLFIFSRLFQERNARELASRCIRWAVLNRGVTVAKVSEVMDITRRK